MRINGKQIPRPVLLGALLIFLIGSGSFGPLALVATSDALAALSGDTLKGKVVDSSGSPVAGAQVQLLSPAKTMMDVTVTGKDGRFTLDLGVLEAKEMAKLNRFYILLNISRGRGSNNKTRKYPFTKWSNSANTRLCNRFQ